MPERSESEPLNQQFPFVGSMTMRRQIEGEAAQRRVSRARVVRDALDLYFSSKDQTEGSDG